MFFSHHEGSLLRRQPRAESAARIGGCTAGMLRWQEERLITELLNQFVFPVSRTHQESQQTITGRFLMSSLHDVCNMKHDSHMSNHLLQ